MSASKMGHTCPTINAQILGIVGAGGIGFYIQTYVKSFQYDKAASVTLAVIAMVITIEAINVALRRRFA